MGNLQAKAPNMDRDKDNKKQKVVQKYNLNEVEDIWSSLLSDESSELDDDQFEGENLLYADSHPDSSAGTEQSFDSVGGQFEAEDLAYVDSSSDDVFEDLQALDSVVEQSGNDNPDDESFADNAPGEEQILEEPAGIGTFGVGVRKTGCPIL